MYKDNTNTLDQLQVADAAQAIMDLGGLSLYEFLQVFWSEVSQDKLVLNWHMQLLCDELEHMAELVAKGIKKEHDLIVNIPPGTTKTVISLIMFPAWCWTKWYWMQFITVSYSATIALKSAVKCRDLVKSERFQMMYPEISIKMDEDSKSDFRVVKRVRVHAGYAPRIKHGGGRFTTSVGGSVTGMHGHIILVDDPLNPQEAASEVELASANKWMTETIPTRKTDKKVTPMILIMQRLHQDDPTGHMLNKKDNIKHICLPGEIQDFKDMVKPPEMIKYYKDGLLDTERLDWDTLKEMKADLGQYGYSGQVGQKPTPPGGGMFKVDRFIMLEALPSEVNFVETIRYWDKAGTDEKEIKKGKKAAYTVGVKMIRLRNGNFIVVDVVRGQWSAEVREAMILNTARADGSNVKIFHEQEPGSGGKDSAKATTRMLAGFSASRDLPTGDKTRRADPYSVQVNEGNVMLLKGEWNYEYIEEHRFFPFSTYKDQVDASSGAFTKLIESQRVQVL